jgi:hypothetical protein
MQVEMPPVLFWSACSMFARVIDVTLNIPEMRLKSKNLTSDRLNTDLIIVAFANVFPRLSGSTIVLESLKYKMWL